jgi:hypothetical protein
LKKKRWKIRKESVSLWAVIVAQVVSARAVLFHIEANFIGSSHNLGLVISKSLAKDSPKLIFSQLNKSNWNM